DVGLLRYRWGGAGGTRSADAHEKVGEREQIVLLPDIVRVAMALGALQSQPQKGVRHLQGTLDAAGVGALPVEIERTALRVRREIGRLGGVLLHHRPYFAGPFLFRASLAAGGEEDALGELIVGRVFEEACSQPFVV